MCQTEQSPGSETLWQRELQGYGTILCCSKLRIEEGGLIQVLTHLYTFFLLGSLCVSVSSLIHLDLNGLLFHCYSHWHGCIFNGHRSNSILHPHAGTHQSATGEVITMEIGRGINILIEMAEHEVMDTIMPPVIGSAT